MARLVVVPHTLNHTHHHGVFQSPQIQSTSDYFTYDSGRSLRAWHGIADMEDSIVTLPHPINATTCARIQRWVEANCTNDVLVFSRGEPGDYYTSYELVFLDGWYRREEFEKSGIQHGAVAPRTFWLKFETQEANREMVEWVKEKIAKGYHLRTPTRLSAEIEISDDNEAVEFRLRWADHIRT